MGSHWKFVANWRTSRECLIRRLVGNDKDLTKSGNKLDVCVGDTIFLHRTSNMEDRHGFLIGPFVAMTDLSQDIVDGAWNHLWSKEDNPGKRVSYFRWQVEIDWNDTVYSLNLEDFTDRYDDPVVDLTRHAQAWNDVEGQFLLGELKNKGDPVISPK